MGIKKYKKMYIGNTCIHFQFSSPKKWIFLFISLFPFEAGAQSIIQYVDPMIGTDCATTIGSLTNKKSSTEEKGQTFPAVGRPFCMTNWTPETRYTETKCVSPYYYSDKYITGFRGSHWLDGSCVKDYGTSSIMPFSTNKIDTVITCPSAVLDHQTEKATPSLYSVFFNDIAVKFTGTERCGFFKFDFGSKKNNFLYIRMNNSKQEGKIRYDMQKKEIIGYNPVRRIYQGHGKSAGFSGWFVYRFDTPFTIIQKTKQELIVCFHKSQTVNVRIGTSFTGEDAAENNLEKEIAGVSFDEIENKTEDIWNRELGKIRVKGGTKDDMVKFYTALYHCYLLPRIASDRDGSYPGFAQDTLIHKALDFEYYSDFSMWDTYRGLHPLLTVLEPERTLDMVKSLIAKAEQGEWMPIFPMWASYTSEMIGDHAGTMIADAYLKGITDFNTDTAYYYMRKNAFDHPSMDEYKDGKGRRALYSYMKYGYIPLEDKVPCAFHKKEQVSRTLEYAMDDYALAQFAKATGRNKDYGILMKRSEYYMNVFDPHTKYVRGRYKNGTWIKPFTPKVRCDYITEGTAFQYTWYVPHDVPGLISLFGGEKPFLKRLNDFFDNGHYWHRNETDQQSPYMFTMAGNHEKTREWVGKIISKEYGTGPGGLSGNDDSGQMSAWLVLSMMGIYSVCPSNPEYILGMPSFKKVSIYSGNNQKPFVLSVKGENSKDTKIVKVLINGHQIKDFKITHTQLTQKGSMVFEMKNK